MDESRLDTLAKTLAGASSRRQVLRGLLIASLTLLGGAPPEEAVAHNAKKKCQKKSGDAKKKCLKKAKKHNASHTTPLPADATPVGPPPPEEIPATCSDGIQNGSESDVDCGGPDCLRCAVGQGCFSAADCGTSFCVNNVCQACDTGQCGAGCSCSGGSCVNSTPVQAAVCADCPPYSLCADEGAFGPFCFLPCA